MDICTKSQVKNIFEKALYGLDNKPNNLAAKTLVDKLHSVQDTKKKKNPFHELN